MKKCMILLRNKKKKNNYEIIFTYDLMELRIIKASSTVDNNIIYVYHTNECEIFAVITSAEYFVPLIKLGYRF